MGSRKNFSEFLSDLAEDADKGQTKKWLLGSYTTRRKKISARAGVHSQAKASALRKTGIEAAVLDFESPESIAPAFKGIDTLFLVTAGSPDQGRHEENLLAEAKKVGVKRIVKLSEKIADHHTIGFSQWNREAERRINESGIPYTILPGNYFMQRMKTARSGAQSPFEL